MGSEMCIRDRRIEVYSDFKKKGHAISDLNRFTINDLIQLVGEEPVLEHIHDGKEAAPGMSRMSDVRRAARFPLTLVNGVQRGPTIVQVQPFTIRLIKYHV